MIPYLAINVTHLDDLLARQKMPRRLLLNYYAAMYGGPLTISPAVLHVSVNDLKEHIRTASGGTVPVKDNAGIFGALSG